MPFTKNPRLSVELGKRLTKLFTFKITSYKRNMFLLQRSIIRQFITSIICDILIVDNGFQEGWSTPMLPKFGKSDPIVISSEQSVLIVNLLYIGTGVGAIFLFFIMNRIGRKTILQLCSLPKMASWLLFALADSYTLICLARFLGGLSHGVTFTILSIYQCEITTKQVRGVVGAVMSELINISVLVIYITGIWLSRFNMSMIALSIQVIFFISFIRCAESPYYLVRKNREDDAKKTLKWLLDREDVSKELEEVKRIVAKEDALADVSFREQLKQVFSKRENRRASMIALIMAASLTWCGCAPVFAYQSYTYSVAGSDIPINVSIMLAGSSNIIGGLVCIVMIRKLGKRLILLISMPIITASLMIVATFLLCLELGYDVRYFSWIPTVFLVTYIFSYGFALYPLVYTYMGEIFPYEMKTAAAISFAIFFSASSVGSVQCYQALLKYGLYTPFCFFGVISIIMWILIYMYVPETEHKSLEEILLELQQKKSSKSDVEASNKSESDEKYVIK